MVAIAYSPDETGTSSWQEEFLKMLPTIERCARIAFRNLPPDAKDEAISDVVANAACAFHRLHQREEVHRAYATVLARFAIAQYRDGRRCGTPQCSRDVFSNRAKRKGQFDLCSIGTPGKRALWKEFLTENRVTSVPNQVAFRIDFPNWLASQSQRDQRIAERLSLGFSTTEVAREFDVSLGRISQIRRQLAESWYHYINAQLNDAAVE